MTDHTADRETIFPDDAAHEAHRALLQAAQRFVAVACGDQAAADALQAHLAAGAACSVTVAFPAGAARISLHRPNHDAQTLAEYTPTVERVQ